MPSLSLDTYEIQMAPITETLPALLEKLSYGRLFVLVDENTAEHCLPRLREALQDYAFHTIQIRSGERNKDIGTCQLIWQQLMQQQAGRDALLLNLGGGVIGDMGGFCAGTFKRGIRFVQIPTTLLSQVDASVGGKLGIDFMQVKNSIGLFLDPQAVLIDPTFLLTLPPREVRSGFAEIIKHSLIQDAGQWGQLQQLQQLETADWIQLIPDSVAIKKRIVEEDRLEQGLRKALNFGHTIGHAIEGHALQTDAPLLHGEAIAIGMVCEAYLSHQLLGLGAQELQQISRYILDIYGHHPIEERHYPTYLQLMRNDKKNEGQAINFSLLEQIGQPRVNQQAEEQLIKESLDFYRQLPL